MKIGQRTISSLVLASVLLTLGAGCGGGNARTELEQVELTYWRVFDNDDAFDEIISSYTAMHPNVKIDYKKWRFDEYEDELVNALAEGTGPDIFSIHNDAMVEYKNLMLPMPESTTITYLETQGTLRKEVVAVEREENTMSLKELKNSFVDVVTDDVVLDYQPDPKVEAEERIFGLPMSVDTLALFSNKELLNAAGISTPPETWQDFQEDVIKLTAIDDGGSIKQSGAGLGTSRNVNRVTDILAVLMMQNGTNMIDERGRVTFHTIPDDTPTDVFPGLDAVRFYTDFANPTKEVYTWNEDFTTSFDAFAAGQTAFYLGYSYDIPLLRTVAPKLDFSISKLPQIEGGREANYANYWVETVSKDTDYPDWAWDFLQYAASADNVTAYLNEAAKPTALRSLINGQLSSEDLGVFAEQLLLAESWYHGSNVAATEEALKDLIDEILTGTDKPEESIEKAARIVAQTYE